MSTYRVRTNYMNPFLVLVWILPFMHQVFSTKFSFFNYLVNQGYSTRFAIYSIAISWGIILFILEYYRGLRYINIEITSEGIGTNWFYWRGRTVVFFGKRVERFIRWEEIEKYDEGIPFGGQAGTQSGFVIKTKNDDRNYFIAYTTIGRKPKSYKAMKADFETHYEDAVKKGLIFEKKIENVKFTDFPDI